MAMADDIDPAQASRRASEGLQRAIESLDRHTEALIAPTMEMALVQKKRTLEIGLEELEPSALTRKFISQAGPGALIGANEPGQLNKDASEPPGTTEPSPFRTGQEQLPLPNTPRRPSEHASIVPGISQGEKEGFENEQYVVPQYGKFQVDAYLRMARKAAMAKAGETEPGSGEPNRWASVAGALNTTVEKAPEYVAGYQAAKSYIKPILDLGFTASSMGTSLGYSPQAGTGINASHIAGIPNPIAAFTSPATKQGLGTMANAVEEAVGGTGIGISEAKQLRETLAAQGWSNQREGGAFGFDVGGNQENLALALSPLVKKGFNSTTSIEQLGEATSALKLGQATPEELKKTLEQLPEAAKTLHKTLEEVTAGMEEFAAKSVEGGSTMIHGMKNYTAISAATGMNPTLIQGINEGQFGQVQALTKGVMPWEIQGMSGNAAALNAWETVKKVAGYVPKQSDTRALNKVTGQWEITETAAEKEGGYIHMLEPSITSEQAKRLKEIGPKLEAVQGGMGEANAVQQHRYAMEQTNEVGKQGASLLKARNEWSGVQSRVSQLKEEVSRTPEGGFFGGQKRGELEEKLRQEEEVLHERRGAYTDAMSKASKSRTLNKGQEGLLRNELEGPKGLYATAAAAGISPSELNKIKKEGLTKQSGDIYKALEQLNKVNVEKQNEENAKIELAGPAKAFFKLKFPSASAKAEANEGGPATASKAAAPNAAGETASEQSVLRQAEQATRAEPTTARD